MSGQDYEQLSLFPGDSPASHSVWPGSVEARMMTVISGQKCLELSMSSGPLGLLEKTLLESSTWRSTRCYLTWKTKDTKQGRLLFRLAVSMPRTGGTDAPSWPTPRANKVGGYSSPNFRPTLEQAVKVDAARMWPTPTARDFKGANSIAHLTREGKRNHTNQLANAVKLWPTPTSRCGTGASQAETRQGGPDLQTAVRMYPTPQARDHFPPHSPEYIAKKKAEGHGMANLNDTVGGQLNPTWVEWLMGFPLGWTDLSASETP